MYGARVQVLQVTPWCAHRPHVLYVSKVSCTLHAIQRNRLHPRSTVRACLTTKAVKHLYPPADGVVTWPASGHHAPLAAAMGHRAGKADAGALRSEPHTSVDDRHCLATSDAAAGPVPEFQLAHLSSSITVATPIVRRCRDLAGFFGAARAPPRDFYRSCPLCISGNYSAGLRVLAP